jgi:hypothetical protein
MADLGRRVALVYIVAAGLAGLTGCEPVTYVPPSDLTRIESKAPTASLPGPVGRITGLVMWTGDVPAVLPFQAVKGMGGTRETHFVPNPFTPVVHPQTRGLAGAVVFLRGVDPSRAKPWDRPPATVEVTEDELNVNGSRVGFVPVGSEVTFVSRNPTPQLVRGRGENFFSFTLPDSDVSRTRRFDRPSRVELSSGAGQFWMRADLFVCEHPYYVVTNARGEFSFDGVPPGRYELVAWHRNWATVRQERDPDSGLVARLSYAEPVEVVLPVFVEPAGSIDVAVAVDANVFHPTIAK